ncbi:T9SS type A sorting domain-containing protein [Fluviicola chungangensis]|uniref:T9SS type A sorting domain-containing protein n=1 Tax=Fluviicola chungangensis TaxID=2597671 RepID=A0A556MR78_9FLAO|nr:T9SS type A sorting domain-containing protein [Fluviicola chungangensis]TSJ42423.1 T9SS type A sorting domain-containing protein [Fluviicola chungangensis]
MKQFFIITFLSLAFGASSQNEVSTLYFGKTLLDFRYEPPLVLSTQAVDPRECAASICDEQGNLLFYSNGGVSPTAPPFQGGVFGSNNQLLSNGTMIDSGGCLSSYQGAIILPDPAGITPVSRKYYLFAKDCLESSFSTIHYNSGLTYSVIDMNANGGQGAVISKYNPVVPYHVVSMHSTGYEPLTAVLDAEGELKSGASGYWLFSYTDDSLYHIHFGVNGFDQFQKLVDGKGYLAVSPSRTHMAVGNKLYRLDPLMGTVQFRENLDVNAYDITFSPDGTKLYVISGTTLKQYDLEQSNVAATEQTISSVPSGSRLLLAPSKRILVFQASSSYIDAEIVCPNNPGMACGWDPANIILGSNALTPYSGKPNIPAHYLYGNSTNCSLGLDENNPSLLSIHPNPATTSVFITGLENETTYVIYSSLGQIVLGGTTLGKEPIDLQNLEKGTYFIELANQYIRFVKQ